MDIHESDVGQVVYSKITRWVTTNNRRSESCIIKYESPVKILNFDDEQTLFVESQYVGLATSCNINAKDQFQISKTNVGNLIPYF